MNKQGRARPARLRRSDQLKSQPVGEGVPLPLEFALTRVPIGSRVLLAGLPDCITDLRGALRDRSCDVSYWASTEEEAHAWSAEGFGPVRRDLEVDLVLLVNPLSDAPLPALLLRDLADRWPGVECVLTQRRDFNLGGAALPRRRRLVNAQLIVEHILAASCEIVEHREIADVSRGDAVGWYLRIGLLPGDEPSPSGEPPADSPSARQDALLLASYRRALGRLRAELDLAHGEQMKDIHEWQAELAEAVALERRSWLIGRRIRRTGGQLVRGLRGARR